MVFLTHSLQTKSWLCGIIATTWSFAHDRNIHWRASGGQFNLCWISTHLQPRKAAGHLYISHTTFCQVPIQGVFRSLSLNNGQNKCLLPCEQLFISHDLGTSRMLSDLLAVWSSVFFMSVALLLSTQAVTKRNKNIKQHWQITLPQWVWDPANHISCQWPNKKQGNNGHQVEQTALPSQRGPPHFAGGLFKHNVLYM